jgi:hypothetical protein
MRSLIPSPTARGSHLSHILPPSVPHKHQAADSHAALPLAAQLLEHVAQGHEAFAAPPPP